MIGSPKTSGDAVVFIVNLDLQSCHIAFLLTICHLLALAEGLLKSLNLKEEISGSSSLFSIQWLMYVQSLLVDPQCKLCLLVSADILPEIVI